MTIMENTINETGMGMRQNAFDITLRRKNSENAGH
jgi:hypothetical protein